MNMQHAFDPVTASEAPLSLFSHYAAARRPINPVVSSGSSTQQPKLIRSVVSEAGLGEFVYLQGRSGRRYVFSSIKASQALLYQAAVFAFARFGNEQMEIVKLSDVATLSSGKLYVHLVDETLVAAEEAADDLRFPGQD